MGKVDVIGTIAPDLLEMFNEWTNSINTVSQDREEFIHRTLDHFGVAKPDYNIMILNNTWKHNISIENYAHVHVEIPKQPWGTHGFDIYVFKGPGTVTRHGDGGWINWGFRGRFERINDATVKFFE